MQPAFSGQLQTMRVKRWTKRRQLKRCKPAAETDCSPKLISRLRRLQPGVARLQELCVNRLQLRQPQRRRLPQIRGVAGVRAVRPCGLIRLPKLGRGFT